MSKPHGYEWTEENGALIIRDVPIFVECERGDLTFCRKWIGLAMKKARQRQDEGYFPPLHVRHHESNKAVENVQAAGFFKITRTRMITFRGERKMAIMADLTITDPDTQSMVKDKRLPYRSVEIHHPDGDGAGVDSLALLDHDVPFLELPMLQLAEGEIGVAKATFCYESHEGVNRMIAFRRDDTAHLLFREEDMDHDDDDKKKMQADDEDKKESVDMTSEPVEVEGGEEAPLAVVPSEDPVPLEVAPICAAIRSGEISVAGMDEIIEAIKARTGADPEAAEELAPDLALDRPAPAAVPGGESMARRGNVAKFAALAGENKVLKGRIDAMEYDRTREKDVNEAVTRLDGKPLGSDLTGDLVKFHTDHGGVAFAAYVDALDKNVGPTPQGRSVPTQSNAATSNEAQKYLELGSDAVTAAVQFSADWRELQESGHINKKEDRYVAVAMAQSGFHLKN